MALGDAAVAKAASELEATAPTAQAAETKAEVARVAWARVAPQAEGPASTRGSVLLSSKGRATVELPANSCMPEA